MTAALEHCTDGELSLLAQAGRQPAYRELLHRHRDAVYRLIRGSVVDADEALDVTQETFVAAFQALDRYDGVRPFRSWIARIAINKCRDWWRRRAVRRWISVAMPEGAAEMVADTSVPIDRDLDGHRRLESVAAAIGALPAALKEPLLLTAIAGMSQAEAAAVLGVSEKAVELRLRRARKTLGKSVADEND